jgi:hypothetical protein
MELTETLKTTLIETAKTLRGSQRRLFMARIVASLGRGGQRRAEQQLGWNRATIRRGLRELQSGIQLTNYAATRGRRRAEERLPNLLTDIRDIAAGLLHPAQPLAPCNHLPARLSAGELRRQLILQKGYQDAELPAPRTLRNKLKDLGLVHADMAHRKPRHA